MGIDAATGREIPRSYVDWLEKRVKHLESTLKLEQQAPPGEEDGNGRVDPLLQPAATWGEERATDSDGGGGSAGQTGETGVGREQTPRDDRDRSECRALHLRPDIENLVNQVGLVGVQGTSAPGFMGGSSGISYVPSVSAVTLLPVSD